MSVPKLSEVFTIKEKNNISPQMQGFYQQCDELLKVVDDLQNKFHNYGNARAAAGLQKPDLTFPPLLQKLNIALDAVLSHLEQG